MLTPARKSSNWQKLSAAFLTWESAAGVSDIAQQQGYTKLRIPYITEVLRATPKPVKAVFTFVALPLVVWDHLKKDDERKWF